MCNRQHHDHIVLTACPWPDADLEIAECPECRSTLSRALTWTPIQTLGVALARVGHYIQFRKEAV